MLQSLHYTIHEVVPFINWTYFFHAWGIPARYVDIAQIHGCDSCRALWLAHFSEDERGKAAEAMQLFKEAQRMLHYLDHHNFKVRVRFGLFQGNSDGEDIIIYDELRLTNDESQVTRLSFLRQQSAPYLCLADFLRPLNPDGAKDRIGIFCAAADETIEHQYEPGAEEADDYKHLLCQTLADRLAEAATERAHQAIRRYYWGYAPDEDLPIKELLSGHFRGIRPAVGYPCLPDQSLNFDLDRLIDFSSIGIQLTESGAMRPHAAVSGLMLSLPAAHYFDIGHIGSDQFFDYARRKGRTPDQLRPFLAANM